MKIVHHNDADGKCAAFWVLQCAHVRSDDSMIDFIEMNYNKKFPLEKVKPNEYVYIVDYSIEPDEMRELLTITSNVVWIDHHITAIEKYKDFEHIIPGLRVDGTAACLLTWVYFNRMIVGGNMYFSFLREMCNDAPWFTKLIADNDVWQFRYGDDTRYFCTALNSKDLSPMGSVWAKLYSSPEYTRDMIKEGETMMKFRDGWAAGYMKIGFETEFEGHLCYACNLGKCNSDFFKSLPKGKYDIFMPFVFNGDCWNISLYSEKVDVSEIAKKYGGGGHKGAAGFHWGALPFKKKVSE